MTRSPLVSIWVVAAVFGAGSAVAAEQRPPVLTKQAPPPAAPTPATTSPAAPRAISPTLAARLAEATPKFESVAPAPAKPIEPGTDLREIDKPRNTIIRLPEYLVQEDGPRVLKEREVATPESRLRLALKKHPGLRLGSFGPFNNNGVALAMLAEEERLERMREMSDLLTLLPVTEHRQVKQAVDQAFTRFEFPR